MKIVQRLGRGRPWSPRDAGKPRILPCDVADDRVLNAMQQRAARGSKRFVPAKRIALEKGLFRSLSNPPLIPNLAHEPRQALLSAGECNGLGSRSFGPNGDCPHASLHNPHSVKPATPITLLSWLHAAERKKHDPPEQDYSPSCRASLTNLSSMRIPPCSGANQNYEADCGN